MQRQPNPDQNVLNFLAHVPFWGGQITYRGKNNINLVNTCPIDNLMFGMWVVSKLQHNFFTLIPIIQETPILLEIIRHIDNIQWNLAKQMWVVEMMRYNHPVINRQINLYGSERGKFLDYLNNFQMHKLIQLCNDTCINNRAILRENSHTIFFIK